MKKLTLALTLALILIATWAIAQQEPIVVHMTESKDGTWTARATFKICTVKTPVKAANGRTTNQVAIASSKSCTSIR